MTAKRKFTVLGGNGFIGRAVTRHLLAQGHDVSALGRETVSLKGRDCGHVIYAIGLTGDFRTRPYDAIDAHVNVLHRMMDGTSFDSWLYLSSTRVYGGLPHGEKAREDAALPVRPSLDGLYDISKLLGESLCLSAGNPAIRIARLSNVYGAGQSPHTFLGSILESCAANGTVTLRESPQSSKDYVSIDDVVAMLEHICLKGTAPIYNVASGNPVTHDALANALRTQGYKINFMEGAPTRSFPTIDTALIDGQLIRAKNSLISDIPSLLTKETAS